MVVVMSSDYALNIDRVLGIHDGEAQFSVVDLNQLQ